MWVDTGVTDGRINAPAPHTTRCGARCRPSSGVSDFRFRVLFNFHANICACGMRNSQFWYNIWFLCAPGCRPNILAHPHIQYFVCIFITHIGPFAFVRFRSRHWKLNKFPLPLQKIFLFRLCCSVCHFRFGYTQRTTTAKVLAPMPRIIAFPHSPVVIQVNNSIRFDGYLFRKAFVCAPRVKQHRIKKAEWINPKIDDNIIICRRTSIQLHVPQTCLHTNRMKQRRKADFNAAHKQKCQKSPEWKVCLIRLFKH